MNKLPKNWSQGSLCQFFETITGSTPSKSNNEYYGGSIPFVKPPELLNNYIHRASDNLSEEGASVARILPPGSILISCIGNLGKIAVNSVPVACNQQINAIKPNDKAMPAFMFYQVLSPAFNECLHSLASGTTVPIVNKSKFNSISICIPPLPEQKRIVAILDEAFAGISLAVANAEKNLANTRELFESYLNNVFTQKGDGWVEKKLGDICSIKHGFAFKSEFFSTAGDYVLLTPGSFHEKGGFRDRGKKTKYYTGELPTDYILNKGDFLFAMTEQSIGLLGSSMITPESNYYLHNQRLGLIQINNDVSWDNDFFHHQFNTNYFRAAVQTTASGLKVRHTSPTKLGAISIAFPPDVLEQKKIASKLNKIQIEIQNLDTIYQQKLTALNELKQSILQKAFAGELTKGCDNG